MLVALVAIMLLGGGLANSMDAFVKNLDKNIGKELQDPAARAQAQAAVQEMKTTFADYEARLKQIPQELAAKNAGYAVSDEDFEQQIVHLTEARTAAFELLVASRGKLRQAIPAEQWDATVGAASRE